MKYRSLILCCLLGLVSLVTAQESSTNTISPKVAMKVIAILENDPLGEKAEMAIKAITIFAMESDKVMITLSEEVMSWVTSDPPHKYGKLLLGAFLAGNCKAQLEGGICEDQHEAGIAQVIETYKYLKAHTELEPIAEIETWIKDAADEDSTWTDHLAQGKKKIDAGEPLEAIAEHFNPVIMHFEETFKDDKRAIFCADNRKEAMAYAALSISNAVADTDTLVLPQTWAEAYYLQAYSFVELSRLEKAKEALRKALKLSPGHASYWSELGHVFQIQKNWPECLAAFEKAAESAALCDDDDKKNAELARAWRGTGFVLVELNKLDEAEAKYNQCLELNPDDERAQGELKYIEGVRAKL